MITTAWNVAFGLVLLAREIGWDETRGLVHLHHKQDAEEADGAVAPDGEPPPDGSPPPAAAEPEKKHRWSRKHHAEAAPSEGEAPAPEA